MNTNTVAPAPMSRAEEKELQQMSPFEVKNTLIALAEKNSQSSTATLLNAGRGNPNWLLTIPRLAFFALGQFAIEESEAKAYDKEIGIAAMAEKDGIAKRFEAFLKKNSADRGAKALNHFYKYMLDQHKADPDEFVYELVDGILGDHYPTPPRILKYTEIITRDYLRWAMGGEGDNTPYDLFATEGSTAGMCYTFISLQQNYLLNPGDKIALLTPCFTPYLEIPRLSEFGLEVVNISANQVDAEGYHTWQYPDSEIQKLRDPQIKAVCIINPSNPPSVSLATNVVSQLKDVVANYNPDLMIITDDVYGTFLTGFKSLMYELPYNTLCLYSYSKYFGATGWRVAAMALKQGPNVYDKLLASLSEAKKTELQKRYSSMIDDATKLRFIDRLVADSRLVALNHTAGLSTPQQIQMAIFSAFALLHKEELQPKLISMIQQRLENLWQTTGFTLLPDPNRAGYYSEIDLMVWAKKFFGDDFAKWLGKTYEPIDFVVRIAKETAIVLLNGDGFDGPKWSVRASLANLDSEAYLKIGSAIRNILNQYHDIYVAQQK